MTYIVVYENFLERFDNLESALKHYNYRKAQVRAGLLRNASLHLKNSVGKQLLLATVFYS